MEDATLIFVDRRRSSSIVVSAHRRRLSRLIVGDQSRDFVFLTPQLSSLIVSFACSLVHVVSNNDHR